MFTFGVIFLVLTMLYFAYSEDIEDMLIALISFIVKKTKEAKKLIVEKCR